MGGSLQDDAVDVGAGLSLVGEAGVDEAAEEVEERLDASEGLGPEADLGGGREGDGGFFEEEVGSEDGGLRGGEGARGGDGGGADGDRDGVLIGGGGRRKSALTPGPSPVSRPGPHRERGGKRSRHRLGSRCFCPPSSSRCCLPGPCRERRERLG
jgi:hypothetical protein